jgi:hypothetical protein
VWLFFMFTEFFWYAYLAEGRIPSAESSIASAKVVIAPDTADPIRVLPSAHMPAAEQPSIKPSTLRACSGWSAPATAAWWHQVRGNQSREVTNSAHDAITRRHEEIYRALSCGCCRCRICASSHHNHHKDGDDAGCARAEAATAAETLPGDHDTAVRLGRFQTELLCNEFGWLCSCFLHTHPPPHLVTEPIFVPPCPRRPPSPAPLSQKNCRASRTCRKRCRNTSRGCPGISSGWKAHAGRNSPPAESAVAMAASAVARRMLLAEKSDS